MASSRTFFSEAYRLLRTAPQLFLPKLLIAFLYGILLLETIRMTKQLLPVLSNPLSPEKILLVQSQAGYAVFLLFSSLIVVLIDVWISSWYPSLVQQFQQKQSLSFRKAIRQANQRALVVIPSLVGIEIAVSVVLAPLLQWSAQFIVFSPWLLIPIGLALLFASVLLYPLLSVSVLEKKSIVDTFFHSLALSRQHWKSFFWPAFFAFIVTGITAALAWLAEQPEFWILFWIVRFGVAILSTYNAVLNPTAYFGVVPAKTIGIVR